MRCCGSRWRGSGGEECARRAAVSGFGFGGINAHVLIDEWDGRADALVRVPPVRREVPATADIGEPPMLKAGGGAGRVAIVGMGARFGPWESLEAFKGRLLGGYQRVARGPRNWWGGEQGGGVKGYFVGEVKVPVGRFRIPPMELAEMLPQQLLMLQVAADAFEDAGLGGAADGPAERLDTGVFIGAGLDLNTTNFRFRWEMLEKRAGDRAGAGFDGGGDGSGSLASCARRRGRR